MKTRWKQLPELCAMCVIAIAVMGLLGYLPGLGLLGSIKENYIPMAPSTAIGFIALGAILMSLGIRPLSEKAPFIFQGLALMVTLFGLLELAGYFVGMDLNLEDSIVPVTATRNGIAIGRMSPATGALFFLSGMAVFSLIRHQTPEDHHMRIEYFSGGLAGLVLVAGFVFCLAYLFGKPLLYDSGYIIPMALTTALGFILLSLSVLIIWMISG